MSTLLHVLHFIGIALLVVACIAVVYAFLFMLYNPMIQEIERKDREYERLVANRDREFQRRQAIAAAYIAEVEARREATPSGAS